MMFKVVSEMVRAEYEAASRVSEAVLADIEVETCPHCQAAIERREQVGWGIYARPCGCVLMQGRQPEGEGDQP